MGTGIQGQPDRPGDFGIRNHLENYSLINRSRTLLKIFWHLLANNYILATLQIVKPQNPKFMEPEVIEKELVKDLSFKQPVKFKQNPELLRQLNEATRLGNGYHTKVGIIFYDDHGLKRINTTIWATGSRYICLKGGMWIPINNIVELKF